MRVYHARERPQACAKSEQEKKSEQTCLGRYLLLAPATRVNGTCRARCASELLPPVPTIPPTVERRIIAPWLPMLSRKIVTSSGYAICPSNQRKIYLLNLKVPREI